MENRGESVIKKKYIIITPIRDEERFVEKTIIAVKNQTITPIKWIFIDDNSKDGTVKVIEKFKKNQNYIEVIRMPFMTSRNPGGGVMKAFNFGYSNVRNELEYDFVVKLDGDLSIEPDYFEAILSEFDKNSNLGIASGNIIESTTGKSYKVYNEYTLGASKVYKRECLEKIFPIEEIKGWDLLDNLMAINEGYETKLVINKYFYHLKPLDSAVGKLKESYLKGYYAGYLKYLFLFALLKILRTCSEKPIILGGLYFAIGYIRNVVFDRVHYKKKEIIELLHKQQKQRLLKLIKYRQVQ